MSKTEEKVHWECGKEGEYLIIGVIDDSTEEEKAELMRKMKSLGEKSTEAIRATMEVSKKGQEALIWSIIALTISTVALLLQLIILLKRLGLI